MLYCLLCYVVEEVLPLCMVEFDSSIVREEGCQKAFS